MISSECVEDSALEEQDRPRAYYEGVDDGIRYVIEALTSAHGGDKGLTRPVIVVLGELYELHERLENRRMTSFLKHIGVIIPTKKYVDSMNFEGMEAEHGTASD